MSRHQVPGRAAAAATVASNFRTAVGTSKVASVEYVPDADIAGVVTNSLTGQLVNGGPDGSLSIVVAQLAFVAGVNATKRQAKLIPLLSTNGTPVVLEADQLRWESVKVGTGLLDPGGQVFVNDVAL